MKTTNIVLLLAFVAVVCSECATCFNFRRGGLTLGAACADGQCRSDLWCNQQGICAEKVANGSPCTRDHGDAQCQVGSTCVGEDTTENPSACIRNAAPGSACSRTINNVGNIPVCGDDLSCSIVDDLCTGGSTGDACSDPSNCGGGVCSNGLCATLAIGDTCIPIGRCPRDSSCEFVNSTFSCIALPTLGESCVSGANGCVPPYKCMRDANLTHYTCQDRFSRATSMVCSSGQDCQSGRCSSNRCAADGSCQAGCPVNTTCECDGSRRFLGDSTSSCTETICLTELAALEDCGMANCADASSVSNGAFSYLNMHCDQYDGNCCTRACNSQYQEYTNCISGASMFVVSFAMLMMSTLVSLWL